MPGSHLSRPILSLLLSVLLFAALEMLGSDLGPLEWCLGPVTSASGLSRAFVVPSPSLRGAATSPTEDWSPVYARSRRC